MIMSENSLRNIWRQKSIHEKLFLISFSILGITILILLLIYITVIRDNNVCRTNDCIVAAIEMRDAMDSVDPCIDFYQFSCGNYKKRVHIANNEYINVFGALNYHVVSQLKPLIEDELLSKESRVFELVNKLYRSCMNVDKIKQLGTDQFDGILRQIGGSPMVDGTQWNETAFDWIESIRQMRVIGLPTNYLLDTTVFPNFKNSSIRSILISQPGFLSESAFSEYPEKMAVDPVSLTANYVTAPLDVRILAYDLAHISLPADELRDFEALFNPLKISELQIKYPYMRWMDYFKAIMPTDIKITPDEVVIVLTPAYFHRLAKVLQNTSKKTISNFFAWRSFEYSQNYLYTKNSNIFYTSGSEEEWHPVKWERCVSFTFDLSKAVGALYVQKFFNEKYAQHAAHLVDSIKSSFIDMLNIVAWMDENTKKAAVEKAKAIVAHIAFPNELTNKTKLEEHYKSLTLNENEYFLNVLRLRKFTIDNAFRRLHEPVNKTDWLTHAMPAMINAFYQPFENSIVIPAVILQGVFFSADRPNYLNYGAIGQIIGHEITHGFDDLGAQIDKNGNLKDWWLAETRWKFLNRKKCLVEQYGNFTEPNIKINVNGKLTLSENIADNIGLKSAYYAYTKWMDRNSAEPSLPGLKQYTSKQMFWISAAQIWCSLTGELYAKALINIDSHTPNRFRAIGPMRNSKEFAIDFKCAPATPMNPVEKCEIW